MHIYYFFQVEVHSPREIEEIFDAISYCKGASVIRMLSEFLGPDVSSHTKTSFFINICKKHFFMHRFSILRV